MKFSQSKTYLYKLTPFTAIQDILRTIDKWGGHMTS